MNIVTIVHNLHALKQVVEKRLNPRIIQTECFLVITKIGAIVLSDSKIDLEFTCEEVSIIASYTKIKFHDVSII